MEDEAQDHGVGDEGAGFDGGLGTDAEGGAVLDVGAQEVARGDGGELGEGGQEARGLSAFADAWGRGRLVGGFCGREGGRGGGGRGHEPGAPTRMMRAALESFIGDV